MMMTMIIFASNLSMQAFAKQFASKCEKASTRVAFASNSSKGQVLQATLKLSGIIRYPFISIKG